MGIIYLIQPEVLVGTNRYKIGCSTSCTLTRLRSYGKNTRCLYVVFTNKPFEIEKILIEKFNEKFNKIKGNEYFEGNEYDMIMYFNEIYNQFKESSKEIDKKDNINNGIYPYIKHKRIILNKLN